jgi:phage regulator Rha-like protein
MAQTARKFATDFSALGFRVIEGGKSDKRIVLTTVGVAEIFGKSHRHILRDVREYQEKLGPNLGAAFAEHCRPSKYRGNDNTERDCFELTEVGVNAFAVKYDAALRLLVVFAFDALKRGDTAQQQSLINQINARIRELRSRRSGQNELELLPPDADDGDLLPDPSEVELDECEQREQARISETARKQLERIRQDGIQGSFLRDPNFLLPTANESIVRVLAEQGHTPDYDADAPEHEAGPSGGMILTRDEMPLEQTPEAWQAWARENWRRLPLELRQRWWKDTDYGKRTPSPEMIQAIIAIALP